MARTYYLLTATLILSTAQAPIRGTERLPVPRDDEVQGARALANEIAKKVEAQYPDDTYSAVKAVLDLAASEQSRVRKYAIMSAAADMAASHADAYALKRALGVLDATFNGPFYQRRLSLNKRIASKLERTNDKLIMLAELASAAREAIAHDDFDAMRSICQFAARHVPGEHKSEANSSLVQLRTQGKAREQIFHNYREAVILLRRAPDNSLARLNAGLYECLIQGDFGSGLVHFLSCDKPELRFLARLEQNLFMAHADMQQLAEEWWSVADKLPGACRKMAFCRAAHWYEQLLPALTGLDKALAARRIEESRMFGLIPSISRDLLEPSLPRVIRNGAFDGTARRLSLHSSERSFCQFGCTLSDNYDLTFEFTRTSGRWGLLFHFSSKCRSMGWGYAGHENRTAHFLGFHGDYGPTPQVAAELEDEKLHSLLIRARENRITVTLDDKSTVEVLHPHSVPADESIGPAEVVDARYPSVCDYWGNLTVTKARAIEFW